MEETQKRTIANTDAKKKSTCFDDEIGDDFLTSWKSTAVTENALDFNCETPPGKKKGFKFCKLDMDFDFDKISSFKLDMSDLDFSSPPKKPEKAKETLEERSNLGRLETKRDLFTLDFDFTEPENFSINASSPKGLNKLNTSTLKDFDCSKEQMRKESAASKSTTSLDQCVTQTTTLPRTEEAPNAKSENLVGSKLNTSNADSSSCSPNLADQDVRLTATSPVKSTTNKTLQSPGECNEVAKSTEPTEVKVGSEECVRSVVQEISSITIGDELLGSAPDPQPEDVYTNECKQKENIQQKKNTRHSSPNNSRALKRSLLESITESPIRDLLKLTHVDSEDVAVKESAQKDMNNKVPASSASALPKKLQNDTKQIHNTVTSVLLSPPSREMAIGKHVSEKEQTAGLDSAYVKKSEGAELQSLSSPKKSYSVCDNNATTNKHTEELQRNVEDGKPQVGNLVSLKRAAAEGSPVRQENEKTDNKQRNSRLQVPSANSSEKADTSSSQKSTISKLPAPSIMPPRHSSVSSVIRPKISPLVFDKKAHSITSPSTSRELLNLKIQKQIKTAKHPEMEMPLKLGSKKVDFVHKEKIAFSSPSLKRKFEVSGADSVDSNPSKRTTESPFRNCNDLEASFKNKEEKFCQASQIDENLDDNLKNGPLDHASSSLYSVPMPSTTSEEGSLLIDNDGSIEKAEACGKQLDDICNMLKKKHDEAKELLVRAVVNNNLLLMLNHPIYDDKIQKIQKLSNHLASKEWQF